MPLSPAAGKQAMVLEPPHRDALPLAPRRHAEAHGTAGAHSLRGGSDARSASPAPFSGIESTRYEHPRTHPVPADLKALPRGSRRARRRDPPRDHPDRRAQRRHLAPNLGVVEAVAGWVQGLRFAGGQDRLGRGPPVVPARLLTGRRPLPHTAPAERHRGLLRRAESEHDHFGTSHGSTSIAAALGFAAARPARREPTPRDRGHRRRRLHGRHGVRGTQQRGRELRSGSS